MEILMKLKCSPSAVASPGGSPGTHSTLKVIDHHHQLQQHTLGAPHMRAPSSLGSAVGPSMSQPPPPPSSCMEYASTMDCCRSAAVATRQELNMVDLKWEQQRRLASPRNAVHGHGHGHSPMEYSTGGMYDSGYCGAARGGPPPACCSGAMRGGPPPPCCSGGAGILYGIATPPPPPLHLHQQQRSLPPPPLAALTETHTLMTQASMDYGNMSYEYQEPEENFVSIDDAKIKGFLIKIGQEQAKTEQANRNNSSSNSSNITANIKEKETQSIVYEIIELADDEEREKLKRIKNEAENHDQMLIAKQTQRNYHRQTKSPSISLIPRNAETEILPKRTTTLKSPPNANASEEKIIAQIELLDSSDDSEVETDAPNNEDDDDEELPLAAAAVSCELQCDDDSDDVRIQNDGSNDDVVILGSDDENIDFIDKHEEGLELRWDDLEEQKERTFFECFLCGKKVQSSYNLRRHMMIHTGERPFGCDMCERRFREFSDLKKHRRRHINDPNFVCMVCRINKPIENDPTRCSSCDSRNGPIVASMRPQLATSPEKSQTPPMKLLVPSRNQTPAPSNAATPTPPPPPTLVAVRPSSATSLNTTACYAKISAATDVPSLVPINSSISSDAQLFLDSIPAVHRPSYNQLGVVTRKEFPCPLCQRPFGTRHNLKRHFMIHTGEKPFSCSRCRKPFREYSTLKKHMVTHQRDRWYKCLRCPKKYRDYMEYSEHKKVHPSEEQSSTSSNASSPKKKTKLRHSYDDCYDSNDDDSSTEDWLECCECHQRFTDIEAYTEHLKEHDPGMFLYECYICRSTFEEREELVQHVTACKQENQNASFVKLEES